MQPPFPSPTPEWHNTTYPSIDPTRPELSAAGKKVIVTGGSRGIGQEIVRAFAAAGAESIAIIGRTEKTLKETKALVESESKGTAVSIYVTDMSNAEQMKKTAAAIGSWDVLDLNAGYMNDPLPMLDIKLDDWWKTFEINVKGQMIAIQSFAPTRKANSTIIGTSTAGILFPNAILAKHSDYSTSKLAIVKFFEMVAVVFPDIHVVTLHPGVVETEMAPKAELPDGFDFDDVKLPGHFSVWLASPEAKFLRGKFVWTNWDVDQLKAKAKEIQENEALWTATIAGWPFQPL